MPKTETLYYTESVRQHVRGGYHERRDAPHVVLNQGEIEGTWYPGTSGLSIEFIAAFGGGRTNVDRNLVAAAPFRPAPKPSAKPRRK